MRSFLLSAVLIALSTHLTHAQAPATQDENYKHANIVHQHNATTLTEDTLSLRNQKTHKSSSRKYVVAPSDSLPNRNIQGTKNKANYKNQFK